MKKFIVFTLVLIILAGLFTTSAFAASRKTKSEIIWTRPGAVSGSTASTETSVSIEGANVKNFGAKGDGLTDDTAAIQNVLNQYDSVYIPDGTYLINVDISLKPKSNQTITLSSDAVLKALPSARDAYSIILISKVTNVTVTGGQLIGDRYSHLGTIGEMGNGVNITNGSTYITISNMKSSDCWGDGFYLGGYWTTSQTVRNITLDNVVADNNRRQGLSITDATQVMVSNSIFMNTNGTAPSAGIDVETNAGKITSDITFLNDQCYGNAGVGLSVNGWNTRVTNVNIIGGTFSNNNDNGFYILNVGNLTCTNSVISNNRFGIEILNESSDMTFTNVTVNNSQLYGLGIKGMSQKTGIERITFTGCNFYNNSQNTPKGFDGVRITTDSGYIKNVTFQDCSLYDNQVTKTQRYGISVNPISSISDIVINSCKYYGNVYGGYLLGNY